MANYTTLPAAVTIVQDKYSKSEQLATTASTAAAKAADTLAASVYAPPTISLQWTSTPAPNLPNVPTAPNLQTLNFVLPSGKPSSYSGSTADLGPPIDNFSKAAPALHAVARPNISYGSSPTVPQMSNVSLPAQPSISFPTPPTSITLNIPQPPTVDLAPGWFAKLNDLPEMHLVPPVPVNFSPSANYSSELLRMLSAQLRARLEGGTGLNPAIEQQIWDRARDRESKLYAAQERDVFRNAEALGFGLPSGVLAGQLAEVRREHRDKLASLSRDVAIKQAEMEQENLKHAIEHANQLESSFMDHFHKMEALRFEAAKSAADQAIAVFNASVDQYKALMDGYRTYASAYDSLIRGELAKVEIYKARISAEELKANIDRHKVERYKAEMDGVRMQVEVYKAQIGAAQALVDMERIKISAAGEQIRAFVATVNAEVAKVEAYKAELSAENMKMDGYKAEVQAYAAKVSAQAERARVGIAKYQAEATAKAAEWDGWKASLAGEVAKIEGMYKQNLSLQEGYKMAASAAQAQAAAVMRRWESDIQQYTASKTLAVEVGKANAQAVMHANDARMEAAKVSLATASQQAASAWAMVSASANISHSSSTIDD